MNYHFGLIGYPISFSLSPVIHQSFFEKTKLEGEYSIIDINPQSDFEKSLESLRDMNLDGFNVTVPYKEKIIPFLDEIDSFAESVGAVNTVLNKDGKWIGYNTDGLGYINALEDAFPRLKEINHEIDTLILGAGGAAKGIYHGLKRRGYEHVSIANRTVEKALEIVEAEEKVFKLEEIENKTDDYQLIIQTSSVGMKPNHQASIIKLSKLKQNAIVSDIVYQPMKTNFLVQAEALGADLLFGHKMLIYQAQLAFEIWTGVKPDVAGLDEALQTILEG